ncbi:helix-turn-helix protein [anaerobic digester metagenome]
MGKKQKNSVYPDTCAQLRTSNVGSEKSSELGDFSANHESFGSRVSEARKSFGFTQKDLAQKIGVTTNSIQNYEKGQVPSGDIVVRLAKEFDCSTDWLLAGEGAGLGQKKTAAWKLTREAASDTFAKTSGIGAPTVSLHNDHEEFDFAEVMAQTIDILKSKTVYTTAIVSNIKAFHKAITTEQQIENMQGQLNQALASFASFQEQLDKTNQVLANLRAENQQLRQELEQSRAGSALSDTG